ncbi:hypothetical protein ACQP1O_22385 [Nocardia sp. CA-151230]
MSRVRAVEHGYAACGVWTLAGAIRASAPISNAVHAAPSGRA